MDIEQAEVNQKKKRANALLLDQNNFESMALNILLERIKVLQNLSEDNN